MKKLRAVLAVTSSCLLTLSASAAVITFETPNGATTIGGPVDATVTFVTSAQFGGSVNIVLQNLLANPTDVAQLLSDIDFTLSGHQGTGILDPNITHSFSHIITVDGNGNPSQPVTVFPAWGLVQNFQGGMQLNVLVPPGIGPAGLLIGPPDATGKYSNANGSIAGNAPHNPFLNLSATFLITNIPGVNIDTTVTSATFSFGTTAGINVPGIPPGSNVPDGGTTVALLGTSITGLSLLRRKLRR